MFDCILKTPLALDVNELFWWGIDITNTHEKSTKNQIVTESYRCGK